MRERVISMDITAFMSWFVNQVANMFTWVYNTLDSITFAGTSLLKVSITLVILVPLVGVLLTLTKNSSVSVSKSERVSTNEIKDDKHKASVTNVHR